MYIRTPVHVLACVGCGVSSTQAGGTQEVLSTILGTILSTILGTILGTMQQRAASVCTCMHVTMLGAMHVNVNVVI